jgi:long-chain fatty acid transport protein
MRNDIRFSAVLAAAVALAAAGQIRAGGLFIQEFGTPTQGTASAGAQAKANDASTAMHNPAGMTRLDDHGLMITAGFLMGDIRFDAEPDTPFPGGDGGQQGGPGPVIGLHYAHAIYDRDAEWLDRVRLGFSLGSVSAAVLDPNDDWSGRYEVQKLGLITLSGAPSVAVRIHERFSLAAGAILMYGRMHYDVAVPIPGPNDGQIEFDGIDDFGAGATVSALWEPSERTRVGAIWTQEIELDLSGDVNLVGLGATTNVTTRLPFAQSARASVVHELSPRLWVGASFRWEQWSSLEKQWVTVSGFKTQLDRGWDDTYGGALGGRWQLTDDWALLAGVGYDSSPVDASDRTADLPVDRQIRVGIGGQYRWTDHRTVGVSFSYANLGPAKIRSETLRGEYENNQLFSLAFYIDWSVLPWSRAD